jgi:NAD-dependent dihydropyrimidine dehydrogenase PreA subunit
MRQNGFAAYPGTALGGLTDYTHLAEVAGLGAIGYHGLLITPQEGARLRINTIYTNITNLPIEAENEHLWVRDFCAMCKKCIRACPVQAIFEQPRPRGDGGMQCIDHAACRDYFNQNYGCAVCLAQCPFSEAGYEKVKARFKGNPKAPQFHIQRPDKPVASHPEAREPRLVPLVVIDYGSLTARIKQMRYSGRLLFGAVGEMWKSAHSIRQNPYSGKKMIDRKHWPSWKTMPKAWASPKSATPWSTRAISFAAFAFCSPMPSCLQLKWTARKFGKPPPSHPSSKYFAPTMKSV